jgi:hypothetical protein
MRTEYTTTTMRTAIAKIYPIDGDPCYVSVQKGPNLFGPGWSPATVLWGYPANPHAIKAESARAYGNAILEAARIAAMWDADPATMPQAEVML